jgi:hypothetical protein
MIVIVEVHLQVTESKRKVWPQYVAGAYARFGCSVVLAVVTPDAGVERWAARPIVLGPTSTVTATVLGPSAIPAVDAVQAERAPALAMLSTLAHMDDPRSAQQALWTFEALASWPEDADGRLADILEAALTTAVRERMEELMETGEYEYQSDFARKYFTRGHETGRAVGQARALFVVLRSRGIAVPPDAARRIAQEHGGTRLDTWTARALTAVTIDDVLLDE